MMESGWRVGGVLREKQSDEGCGEWSSVSRISRQAHNEASRVRSGTARRHQNFGGVR